MKQDRLTILCALLLLHAALTSCGGQGATPTPIVIVVTPAPTQPEAITVVVTPPPPQPEATIEAPTPFPVEVELTAEPTKPRPPVEGIEILEATFGHDLTEEMQPVDPGADFRPDETVYLSLRIRGRPKEGVVTARFFWRDAFIAEAGVDLADVNSRLLFSIGENTYAGYSLTHEQPFPLGRGYRAEVSYDGQPLGEYAFRVVPPPEAIPSQVTEAALAQGTDANYAPIAPTTSFAREDTVHLVGRGDLGLYSWIQADWYVNGELDEAGTRSLTMEENVADTGFAFSYHPEGGWPPGDHFVVLTLNDQELGRYPFTVVASEGTVPLDEAAFWEDFPLPEDAELVEVIEGYDLGFSTAMVEPELFDAYAARLEEDGWQQQAPTEAMVTLPHQLWRQGNAQLLIEIQGLDDQDRTVVFLRLASAQ
jgi:hypothetical protein